MTTSEPLTITGNRVSAIIVGAGSSERMGMDKIFAALGGREILTWSIDTFQNCKNIDRIIIVLNQRNIEQGNDLVQKRKWTKVTDVCTGGKLRQDSVKNGLSKLSNCDWVIIHDAARPFVTDTIIKNGLDAAGETGSAIAAVPAKDTIKSVDSNLYVDSTPDRSKLWAVQTPQVFRFDIIMDAHDRNNGQVTDDAAMVEQAGYRVKIFMGAYTNIKITTPDDMILAEKIAGGISK
jgi:2-C-methyl-D-erythritol 4-phosphate cytidylyltransferase